MDDIILIRNDREIINGEKKVFCYKFDMKDISLENFIMGMELKRD